MKILCYFCISLAWLICALNCHALEPHEVLVLVNKDVTESNRLAEYYMKRRNLPQENILKIRITDNENCTREDFVSQVAFPVRQHIRDKDKSRQIRCLLLMFGLPIKINAPKITPDHKKALKKYKAEKAKILFQLNELEEGSKESKSLKRKLEGIKNQISMTNMQDQSASFDSELALVLKEDYPLTKWQPNPFFYGYCSKEMEKQREGVLLVSRLDGPSEKIVKRMIDDSIEAEKSGLKGAAYFDARWPMPKTEKEIKNDYKKYDYSIHKAAEKLKRSGLLPVIINDKKELFQKGECPNAALYCGWYSLGQYVDAFEWQPGSIGYHIASRECKTLKRKNSKVWCKMMLENGVAATVGPVREPYLHAFPVPELFFAFLLDGYWSLAECYALSQPFWSWQMVLIGDPLYRPFKNK